MNYSITARMLDNSSGEVVVYGTLVDGRTIFDDPEDTFTAKEFDREVKKVGKVKNLLIRVNSRGGSVSAGDAMADMIDNIKASGVYVTSKIEGLGASMGAYFPQAADKVIMSANAMMMIHRPMGGVRGNASDLLAGAEMLEKYQQNLVNLCMRRFKGTEAELVDLIERNGELGTWLTAQEALELGLCDAISEPIEMVACADGCYRINGFSFATDALKGAEGKITYHEVEGGEKMIYNKETDEKIRAFLDEGKAVTVNKDGDSYTVVGTEAVDTLLPAPTAFLTAEQVQEAAGADIKAECLLDMLHTVKDLGMKQEDVAAALKFMASEEKTKMTAKAAERDHFFDLVLTEALENGIRAEGNTFDRADWEELLKSKPLAKVKEYSDKWLAKAEAELNAGGGRRSRVPNAQATAEAPDDCFKF